MSPQARFGSLVWEALHHIQSPEGDPMGGTFRYMTVGEVAGLAQVSKPTARKYLNKLVETGHAKTMQWGRFTVFATTQDLYGE